MICPRCGCELGKIEIVEHPGNSGMFEYYPAYKYANFVCPGCGFSVSSSISEETEPSFNTKFNEGKIMEVKQKLAWLRNNSDLARKIGITFLQMMGGEHENLTEEEWLQKIHRLGSSQILNSERSKGILGG